MKRRRFLQVTSACVVAWPRAKALVPTAAKRYSAARIQNEYSLFLPGESDALARIPKIVRIGQHSVFGPDGKEVRTGSDVDGWSLLAVFSTNGSETAVFEKRVSHQGAIVYVTEAGGEILRIRKGIGRLSNIRPREIHAPVVRFVREFPFHPGPDRLAEYILGSDGDPCYENVAALGREYIGWTLVGNEEAGPQGSLFLQADGTPRELKRESNGEESWAPDLNGAVFDPLELLPDEEPELYRYKEGFSKRTLLGGFLPVANTGVWNPDGKAGYEVIALLPPGTDAEPLAMVHGVVPGSESRRYSGENADRFWAELAGVANHWQHFYEDRMRVDIPDPWLLDAARAGITLARCSYRGLHPTYQIGEGGYTKIPERSHALFPVAHYEFVWAHQLWNLTAEVEPYFQFYLDNYILPDGNFLYNTQDQVEAPLNTGVFLWNSARAYDYAHDVTALQKRLPVLRRMIGYVLERHAYSERTFAPDDRRYGLVWGSPEADLGEPHNDYPNSHPFYFQNAAWTWRGLKEHGRCLQIAGREHQLPELEREGEQIAAIAARMRAQIESSLAKTIAAGNPQMRAAGITPFTPDDIDRKPSQLLSYENHRFMMDWFTADWGVEELDRGHLKHRELAGQQILGLHTDGEWPRTSNFMEHGTLAARIRQDDYRPFLLTLYALCCYAADCGNRYSPEDALLPGSYPGEGSKYGWSAVVNSVLQPTLGLRWLLCYEESDRDVCHLQKAAPKHWFETGKKIHVEQCPTRFGLITWSTVAVNDSEWRITLKPASAFSGELVVHIHPPDGRPLQSATVGQVQRQTVSIEGGDLKRGETTEIVVRT
jgi:hypothetical protein